MELALLVYLISLVDDLIGLLAICVVGFLGLGFFFLECAAGAAEDERGDCIKYFKRSLWTALGSLVLFLLLPNKDTMHTMLGVYAGQALVQMEEAQEVGSKAYQALNKVLDSYLEEP